MAPFAPQVTLSALGWLKRAAKRSSARAANNQACSGPCQAQKTFWRCVASPAVGAWTSSGDTDSINTPNAMTSSPCPPEEEFCPPPLHLSPAHEFLGIAFLFLRRPIQASAT